MERRPPVADAPLPPWPKPKGLAPARGLGRLPRPPISRPFSARPSGPAYLRLRKRKDLLSDWFDPPPGFVAAQTSKSEWRFYKALMLLLDPEKDPRKPPYTGGKTWTYQKALEGGRVPGGQVADFVVQQANRTLGLRVQTERYHVMAHAQQQAKDFLLKTQQRAITHFVDLYDQESQGDRSGAATVAQVARALKAEESLSPIRAGTARRVRELR